MRNSLTLRVWVSRALCRIHPLASLRKRVNSFRYGTWYSTLKVAAVPPVMVT